MQPEDTAPTNQNPYDFILNPLPPPKKSLIPAGTSTKQRLLLVVGGGLVLLMVLTIIFSLIFGGGTSNVDNLIGVAKAQNRIIGLVSEASGKSVSSKTLNFLTTTQLSLQSSRTDIVAQINKQQKVKEKDLAAVLDSQTTQELTTAEQNNRYEDKLTEVMQEELTRYRSLLKTAYDNSNNAQFKKLLSDDYANAELLLAMSGNKQST